MDNYRAKALIPQRFLFGKIVVVHLRLNSAVIPFVMMIYNSVLEAKVAGRNAVNAFANSYAQAIMNALAPFAGKPLITQAGALRADVRKALPQPAVAGGYRLLYSVSFGSMSADFEVVTHIRKPGQDWNSATYTRTSVYVASQANRAAEVASFDSFKPRCTDYTVEAIKAARAAVAKAREALNEAESGLCGFGEHDNG